MKKLILLLLSLVQTIYGIQKCALTLENGDKIKYIHPLDPRIVCDEKTGQFVPTTQQFPTGAAKRNDVNGDDIDDSICLQSSPSSPDQYPFGIPCGFFYTNEEELEQENLCGLYRCDGKGVCRDTSEMFDVYFAHAPHASIILIAVGSGLCLLFALSITIVLIYRGLKNRMAQRERRGKKQSSMHTAKDKVKIYKETRADEEIRIGREGKDEMETINNTKHDITGKEDDENTPAKKYAALFTGFDDIRPTQQIVISSDEKGDRAEFNTILQPIETLKEMAFSVASSDKLTINGDSSLKNLRIIAEYNNFQLPIEQQQQVKNEVSSPPSSLSQSVSSSSPSQSVAVVSKQSENISGSSSPPSCQQQQQPEPITITWFYKPGDFFRNALASHGKLATMRAAADAAGRINVEKTFRHVTCIPPSHVAYYLFEPMKWLDPVTGKIYEERLCVNEEQCVARCFMPHPNANETEEEMLKNKALSIINSGGEAPKFQWNKNAPRGGIILKEFLNEEERNLFHMTGQLPAERGPCILCMRAAWTFDFFTSTLNNRVAHIAHYHPVDVKNGYKKSACLPFGKSGTSKGITMPVRYFDPQNDYHPAILTTAFFHSLVPLWPKEQSALKYWSDSYNNQYMKYESMKKTVELETSNGFKTIEEVNNHCSEKYGHVLVKLQMSLDKHLDIADEIAILNKKVQGVNEMIENLQNTLKAEEVKLKEARKHIPNGYVEDGSVYFFAATRWLSPQAASMGAEPISTYVPVFPSLYYHHHPQPSGNNKTDNKSVNSSDNNNNIDNKNDNSSNTKIGTDDNNNKSDNNTNTKINTDDNNNNKKNDNSSNTKINTDDNKKGQQQQQQIWNHLIDVFVAHTAHSKEFISILLRPFSETCAIIKSILKDRQKYSSEFSNTIYSMPYWSRLGTPTPLSSHAILVATFARKYIVDELRANMAREIDHLAVEKIILKKYAKNEQKDNPTEIPLISLQSDILERRGGLKSGESEPSSIVAAKNIVRRGTSSNSANNSKTEQQTLVAASEQSALAERADKHADNLATAGEQIRRVRFDTSRSTLQYHNEVLREVSEFSASNRPICRWFCAEISACRRVDDEYLVGCNSSGANDNIRWWETQVGLIKSCLGDLNPDLYAPGKNVRREFKSTHIDPESEIAEPAHVVRWVFPTHREVIVSWLEKEPDRHFMNINSKTPLTYFFDNVKEEEEKQNSFFLDLSLINVFDSFWRLVWMIRHHPRCSTLDKFILTRIVGCNEQRLIDGERYTIMAALLLRILVAEKMLLKAVDIITSYKIRQFIFTHIDLYAVYWSSSSSVASPDTSTTTTTSFLHSSELFCLTDHEFIVTSTDNKNSRICLFDSVYPYDSRNNIDSDTPSLTGLLLNCGFFEQNVDITIRTIMHAFEKMVPRACQSRDSFSVTSEACIENVSFATIVMKIIKTTLIGAYPHAIYSWDDGTTTLNMQNCMRAREIVQNAEKDILCRTEVKRTEDNFRKFENGKTMILKLMDLFGMNAVRFSLLLADTFSDVVNCNRNGNIIGFDMLKPFCDVAADLRNVLAEALSHELVNRYPDAKQFLLDNVLSSYETCTEYFSKHANDIQPFGDPRLLITAIRLLSVSGLSCERQQIISDVCKETKNIRGFNKASIRAMTMIIMQLFYEEIGSRLENKKISFSSDAIRSGLSDALSTISMIYDSEEDLIRDEANILRLLKNTISQTLESMLIKNDDKVDSDAKFSHNRIKELSMRVANKSVNSMNKALVLGLPYLILQKIHEHAADIMDVASACISVLHTTSQSSSSSSNNLVELVMSIIHGNGLLRYQQDSGSSDCEKMLHDYLMGDTSFLDISDSSSLLLLLLTGLAERNRKRRRLLSGKDSSFKNLSLRKCIYTVTNNNNNTANSDGVITNNNIIGEQQSIKRERIIRAVFDLNEDTFADAVECTKLGISFGNALQDCMNNRPGAHSHHLALNGFDPNGSFIDVNPTLVQYAIREALAAGISRNPVLCKGFCDNDRKWFPEFLDHTIEVTNWIRYKLAKTGEIPQENEILDFSENARRYKWGDRVFRLYKYPESTRMTKTLAQVDNTFQKIGVDIAKISQLGLTAFQQEHRMARRKLLLEFVMAEHAAHRSVDTECGPRSEKEGYTDHERDMDVLWHFGMRDHGFAVLSTLHRAYIDFAGSNELVKIAEDFTVDEFILVSEYFVALNTAKAINIVPTRCRQWSEATIAALCEKHCVGDGNAVIPNLLDLYTCSSCCSVVNQITAPSCTRHFDLSSCYSVASSWDGLLLCANRRNLSKKREIAKCETADNMSQQHVGNILPSCKVAKIRNVNILNRIIEFFKKYGSKGEKSNESKFAVIMAPCCGKLIRYQKEDWGSDGYRCAACSFARKTDWALPNTCIICGCSLTNSGLYNRSNTTTTNSLSQKGKRTNNRDRSQTNVYAEMLKHRDPARCSRDVIAILQNRISFAPPLGPNIPVAPGSQSVVFALDDDVTFGLLPFGLCSKCSHDRQIVGNWPVFLSTLRVFAKNRIMTNDRRKIYKKNGFDIK